MDSCVLLVANITMTSYAVDDVKQESNRLILQVHAHFLSRITNFNLDDDSL